MNWNRTSPTVLPHDRERFWHHGFPPVGFVLRGSICLCLGFLSACAGEEAEEGAETDRQAHIEPQTPALDPSASKETATADGIVVAYENALKGQVAKRSRRDDTAKQRLAASKSIEEIIPSPAQSTVFPGAVLWSGPVAEGEFRLIHGLQRRTVVSVEASIPLKAELLSFEYDGTRSGFRRSSSEVRSAIQARALETDQTPMLNILKDYEASGSRARAYSENGLSLKVWKIRIGEQGSRRSENTKSHAVIFARAVFYRMAVEPAFPGGYFSEEMLRAQPDFLVGVTQSMERLGEPAYVSEVDYGVLALLEVESSMSAKELGSAIGVLMQMEPAGVGLSSEQRESLANATLSGSVEQLGGQSISAPVFTGLEGLVAAIREVDSKLKKYDPSVGAVPVGFKLSYVHGHEPVTISELLPGFVERRVVTTGADARGLRSDNDIGSDDWTVVVLSHRFFRAEEDDLLLEIRWRACEANENARPERTVFESRSVVSVDWRSQRSEPTVESCRLWSPSVLEPGEFLFRGERHRAVPLEHSTAEMADYGYLSDVEVRFDGGGGDDLGFQRLGATLCFEVPADATKLIAGLPVKGGEDWEANPLAGECGVG